MSTSLFWFRSDLRLHDQAALRAACTGGTRHLLPVFCLPPLDAVTAWGFARMGPARQAWLAAALGELAQQLERLGCPLLLCAGPPSTTLPALASALGIDRIVCEQIAAPQEQAEVAALRAAGLDVHEVWQSSLLDPAALPWPAAGLPATFTPFRQALEHAAIVPPAPLAAPASLPPWPPGAVIPAHLRADLAALASVTGDPRSSLQDSAGHYTGGERAGLAHLARYLARELPQTYKQTRNGLSGADFSSKWSPWLATGALSARRILAELRQYEARHGASDGSYWLWFELLWRDYFRLLHLQYGSALYRARGLGQQPLGPHNGEGFARWCAGRTGEGLVDAAMSELAATGYLSNRLRQVVASYLIYEVGGDWRAGAAWFEAQLLDYDVYSNQGNWLYIAGRGTDPRGGRRFNVGKQTADHDGDGAYRQRWAAPQS
ncbi:DASH family cryptochrome [Massilia sp. DWR3-1-1]|uniref:DASH family cryptochrome n=1 Tax=Massilia sp. DWR3-1-1 TaxID=2804559 RepID=UPI003CEC006F